MKNKMFLSTCLYGLLAVTMVPAVSGGNDTPRLPACALTPWGCCQNCQPAQGPNGEGCPVIFACGGTRWGCCPDNCTIAQGPDFAGCPYLCNKDIDIVFLMDKSGSINETSWQEEKYVVERLINHFYIAPNKTRVALNLFDIQPRSQWCFFTEFASNELLESAVANVSCPECVRGETALGATLHYTMETTLQTKVRDVPTVVVLLTDGRFTESYDYWRTQADILRSRPNTQVASIGVGRIRLDYLRATASSDELVFNAKSFEEWSYGQDSARALCEAAGRTTHLRCLPGWSLDPYSQRCYKWFDEKITGRSENQIAKCASHFGSEPAKILKKGTHYFLKTISSGGFWLNIIDVAPPGRLIPDWVWAPDTPLEWINWVEFLPLDGCIVKGAKGKQRWRQEDCDARHTYVCSLPQNPETYK